MKQDDSGTGEGVLTLVQLEKNSNTRIQVSSILKQHLVLAEIHLDFDMDLGFKFLVVDMALCWCRRSPCKLLDLTWFDIVFVHRPLPKH